MWVATTAIAGLKVGFADRSYADSDAGRAHYRTSAAATSYAQVSHYRPQPAAYNAGGGGGGCCGCGVSPGGPPGPPVGRRIRELI